MGYLLGETMRYISVICKKKNHNFYYYNYLWRTVINPMSLSHNRLLFLFYAAHSLVHTQSWQELRIYLFVVLDFFGLVYVSNFFFFLRKKKLCLMTCWAIIWSQSELWTTAKCFTRGRIRGTTLQLALGTELEVWNWTETSKFTHTVWAWAPIYRD